MASSNEWVVCEEYLNGKFIKFNSNSGYINSKGKYTEPVQFSCEMTTI